MPSLPLRAATLRRLRLTCCALALTVLATPNRLGAQPSGSGNRSSGGPQGGRRSETSNERRTHEPTPPKFIEPAAPPAERALAKQFDGNHDGVLDATELATARALLARENKPATATPTAMESASIEPSKRGAPLATTAPQGPLRTFFLEFAAADWEAQLAEFAHTDLSIPANFKEKQISRPARVRALADVGFTSRPGYKRSLEIASDAEKLTLRAVPSDPTYLRAWLHAQIGSDRLAIPGAEFVQLVINGENWGTYLALEPLDAAFLAKHFKKNAGGHVWTVSAGGNLAYLGEDIDAYRSHYHSTAAVPDSAWRKLILLCKLLAETPPAQLEATLAPHLDIENAIQFLALENATINQAGYRTHAGNYALYLDPVGKFHFIPLFSELTFRPLLAAGPETSGESTFTDSSARAGESLNAPEMNAAAAAEIKARENFQDKSRTDLAMLLSHAFVSRADRNEDKAVSRDEMTTFAGQWFTIMDEDFTGTLTQKELETGVRNFVAPISVRDGRTRQTFGGADPSAIFTADLLKSGPVVDVTRITRDEFVGLFVHWNDTWPATKKPGWLTQADFQRGFEKFLSQSVFMADQTYIAQQRLAQGPGGANHATSRGGRDSGGPGGGGSGVSASIGLPGIPGVPLGRGRGGAGNRGERGGHQNALSYEQLDLATGLDDPARPLLSKFLKPPQLQTRYYAAIRQIAANFLTWTFVQAEAEKQHTLIAESVRAETHKPASYASFVRQFDQDLADDSVFPAADSLKTFLKKRRDYLLSDPLVAGAGISLKHK